MPAPHPLRSAGARRSLARTVDEPVAAVAKELRMSKSCLRNWMVQGADMWSQRTQGGFGSDGATITPA
jgi:hypothetical protein